MAGYRQDLCAIHPRKIVEFYCVKCSKPLCLNCKLTKHEGHETDDIGSAAKSRRSVLYTHFFRIQCTVDTVKKHVAGWEEELQALQQRSWTLQTDIERRHQLIVNIADSWREEAIELLHSITADIEGDVMRQLSQSQRQLDTLQDTERQLRDTLYSGTDCEVIAKSEEMKDGLGNQSEVDKLSSQKKDAIVRPVLQCNAMPDIMAEKTRHYLGSVRKIEMTVTEDGVTAEEKFMCGSEPGLNLFSLCHVDEDPPAVHVSYDSKSLLKPDLPVETFRETGSSVETDDRGEMGRLTFRRYARGRCMFLTQRPDMFRTYSKSLTAAHFRLENHLNGRADIVMVKVLSTDPLKTEDQIQFSLNVGPHRAFDVDESEKRFAVVDEAKSPSMWRTVRLYRGPQKTAVATYLAPLATFQPSDVCFYRLGGQPVLLITDEVNNAIHVVNVQDDRMTFQRYLCAGCPLLVQPTAINVDVSGRLWVACRGGRVVTLTVE